MSKPIVFWGQADGYRVIEFDDVYCELQKWEDGKLKILEVDKTHELISRHLGWLDAIKPKGHWQYRRLD